MDCFPDSSLLGDTEVVNEHKYAAASSHSFILIRQMAAVVIIIAISRDIATLVRRALAEVCPVSMLLVCYYYAAWLLQQLCTTVQAMTIPANLQEY